MTEVQGPSVEADEASVDWEARTGGWLNRGLIRLEAGTLMVERGIRRLIRSTELNPVYHAGTITIFLLGVVFATGLYLTMFFQFGFDASYAAVEALEANLVGRFMRAVHRYSSIAMIVTAAVHGWRTFVVRRFAGPRRMPWATGVVMVAVLWVIGVTGYWLIWDERAQFFNDALTRAVAGTTAGLDFMIDFVLTDAAGSGWVFMLILITLHVGLSLLVGGLLWYHLRRLTRRHWLPPPVWMWIVGGTIVAVGIAVPVGMLPPLDRHLVPDSVPLDPFFLFLLPGTVGWPPALLWLGATGLLALVVFLPWVLGVKPLEPIAVIDERCIGCGFCVADCPYRALEMEPRDNGPHQLLAIAHPNLCVSCGICIGSCPTRALQLGDQPPEPPWAQADAAGDEPLTFVCERHAVHGARSGIDGNGRIVPLPCIGMAHPDLAVNALDAGASSVHFIGCPADDCANLEGNLWLQQRLDGSRRPRRKRLYGDAAISTAWIAPDATTTAIPPRALERPSPSTIRTTTLADVGLKLGPVAGLVLMIGLATVAVSTLPFDPGGNDQARIELALDHRDGAPLLLDPDRALPAAGEPARLVVDVDGAVLLDSTYPLVDADAADTSLAFERVAVSPGTHEVAVSLEAGGTSIIVFDDTVALAAGQTLTVDILDAQVVAKADAGRSLYFETTIGTNAGCRICHSLDPNVTLVGPSFAGVATRAAERVPGLTAEDYLRQSILDPDAFVVDGFPAGQMIPTYLDILGEDDVDNLVAFLLTLEEE